MIDVSDLKKSYGDTLAVSGVSFQVPAGEILGILGPNGAGKTTTLRMITGYLSPSSGKISVAGMDVEEKPREVKRQIGYLPESAPLYSDMLVFDYLDYVAHVRSVSSPRKRLAVLADECDIREVMHKPISTLSKGYRQRVGLAQALMSDPEILILDEATSGLDPNQIVEIRSIIKEISARKTILLSTHILSEAEATCDRILIFHRGKVVADGATESLRHSFHKEKHLHVTLAGVSLHDAKERLGALPSVLSVTGTGDQERLELTLASSGDSRQEVYAHIKSTSWRLLEFSLQQESLESVFRQLTKEIN